MFGKNDRSAGRAGTPLLILLVLAVLAVAGGGSWWWRATRQQQLQQPVAGAPASGTVRQDGQLRTVALAVPAPSGLVPLQTSIPRQHEAQLEARAAVAALLAADRGEFSLLRDCALRGFYLDEGGTAYVDLAPQGRQEVRASARGELLALYAVANTLTMNFPEVRHVRFLVDGKEAQSLAGHMDLARAYSKRPDLMRAP